MRNYPDIRPFLQASQVITVNEQLPLTPVEPEVMTERRTVKICCCIPKGDVLLNAWYINRFLFFLYSEALCMWVDPQEFHLMLRAMTNCRHMLSVQHKFIQISNIRKQKSNRTLRQFTFINFTLAA